MFGFSSLFMKQLKWTLSLTQTPLMAAATNGHLQCVKLLLSHSANINFSIPGPKSRSTRQTPLFLATKHSQAKVAEYLQACLGRHTSLHL